MTLTLRPRTRPEVVAPRRRISLGEMAAPFYIVLWVMVQVEPFELLRPMPGSAASIMLPGLGVGVLLLTPREALRRIPISFTLVALVLWMSASFIWTGSTYFTFLLLRNELPALVMLWLVVGTMRPHVAATVLLATFSTIGAWSLLTSLTLPMSSAAVQGLGPEGLQRGWRGTFGHKNILGIFVVIGMSVVLAFERRPGWRRGAVAVLLLVSFGTRSATAASGMLATFVAHWWMTALGNVTKARERALLKLVLIMTLVIAVLTVVGVLPLLLGVYGKDLTFSGRTEIWAATLEAIDGRPLLGYGIGGVWFDVRAEVTQNLHRTIGFGASHAHSGALNLWIESGLVGLVIFTLFVIRTFQLAGRCLGTVAAPYGRWAISTLCALLLMSLSEPLFRGFGLGIIVMLWTVLARVDNDRIHGRPFEPVPGIVPWWQIEPAPRGSAI